jgi:hypothetical protein
MTAGRAKMALSRFAAQHPSTWFVLYFDKTGDSRVSHESHYSKWPIQTIRKHLKCLTLRNYEHSEQARAHTQTDRGTCPGVGL